MHKTVGFVALLTTLAIAIPALAQEKPILAVMEIEDETGKSTTKQIEQAAKYLRSKLEVSGTCMVVPKSRQDNPLHHKGEMALMDLLPWMHCTFFVLHGTVSTMSWQPGIALELLRPRRSWGGQYQAILASLTVPGVPAWTVGFYGIGMSTVFGPRNRHELGFLVFPLGASGASSHELQDDPARYAEYFGIIPSSVYYSYSSGLLHLQFGVSSPILWWGQVCRWDDGQHYDATCEEYGLFGGPAPVSFMAGVGLRFSSSFWPSDNKR